MGNNGAKKFLEILVDVIETDPENFKLKYLDLSNNLIDNDGFQEIYRVISRFKGIYRAISSSSKGISFYLNIDNDLISNENLETLKKVLPPKPLLPEELKS